ncbi:MAG: hypothetical protein WKF57_12795 [Nakamurella sp.]
MVASAERARAQLVIDGSEVRYAALRAVIDRAVTLGLADSVSITEIRTDGLVTRVATDPDTAQADESQYQLGEGPCVDCAGKVAANVIVSANTAQDARWPRWGAIAAERGCAAVISCQRRAKNDPLVLTES